MDEDVTTTTERLPPELRAFVWEAMIALRGGTRTRDHLPDALRGRLFSIERLFYVIAVAVRSRLPPSVLCSRVFACRGDAVGAVLSSGLARVKMKRGDGPTLAPFFRWKVVRPPHCTSDDPGVLMRESGWSDDSLPWPGERDEGTGEIARSPNVRAVDRYRAKTLLSRATCVPVVLPVLDARTSGGGLLYMVSLVRPRRGAKGISSFVLLEAIHRFYADYYLRDELDQLYRRFLYRWVHTAEECWDATEPFSPEDLLRTIALHAHMGVLRMVEPLVAPRPKQFADVLGDVEPALARHEFLFGEGPRAAILRVDDGVLWVQVQ